VAPRRRLHAAGPSAIAALNNLILARMAAVFEREPSSHWEALFAEGKAPGATVRTTQEWLQHDHPVAAGLLVDVEDGQYGLMRQPANVAWLGASPLSVRKRARRQPLARTASRS
jgi:crotonobetainyl-CoA:carnitine CoA-transferase CaiB-like acyl-CoA transferase